LLLVSRKKLKLQASSVAGFMFGKMLEKRIQQAMASVENC
jgi:hypothetical protein